MRQTVTVTLNMDTAMLHCIFYSQPLKPPVFKCKGSHLACSRYISELPGNRCHKCVQPRGGFKHDPMMDAVVSAAMIECPHNSCGSLVANHQVHDHKIACPHAPCTCTEPDYDFTAPPTVLVVHLAAAHLIQVHRLQPYDMTKGEDGAVFVLIIGALGLTTIMSTVCVRVAACVWPLYTVRMRANGMATSSLADGRSRTDTMNVLLEASSYALLRDIVFDELTSFLSVPPWYLVVGGPSKLLRFYKENNP